MSRAVESRSGTGRQRRKRSVIRLTLVGLLTCNTILTVPAVGPAPGPNPVLAPTPGWDTAVSLPNDPTFFKPNYPIVFVATPVVEATTSMCRTVNGSNISCSTNTSGCTGTVVSAKRGSSSGNPSASYHIGTDVITSNDPDPGGALYIYLPSNGRVAKLFPLPVHQTNHIIDFDPASGTVVEPSISEDGQSVLFSYGHDVTNAYSTNEWQAWIPWTGFDIMRIQLTPLLNDPTVDPATLIAQRLTTRVYQSTDPNNPASRKQTVADRDKDAMNKVLTGQTSFSKVEYGTAYLHPTEMRAADGLKLVYASNKRRLENADFDMGRQNNNFNLFVADVLPDGTLGPTDNQFQYFTTMSALSPFPLRSGIAASIQSTTEDARSWVIHKISSNGIWDTVLGYGANPELFHLGSFCVGEDVNHVRKDYLVAARYYNVNNEGFGTLWRQDLATTGKNTYTGPGNIVNGYYVPVQVGSLNLTPATISQDYPAPKNGAGQYRGKLTSPRCGGINELYFSYSPTSANSRLYDDECNIHIYHAYIGYRSGIDPFVPDQFGAGGHLKVIKHTQDGFNLMWPSPVVSWSVRSGGDVQQQFSPGTKLVNQSYIVPGEPFAQVGTSALYNTDRRPFECYFSQQSASNVVWYTPWGKYNVNEENDHIGANQDGWTITPSGNPPPFCAAPDPTSILGVAINVTSNKTDHRDFAIGYTTSGSNGAQEAVKLLGVYDVSSQVDQSFRAVIPAHVPFEFVPLSRQYGLKLSDTRFWHQLDPREMRVSCGGCHQHDAAGTSISFNGTYAHTHAPADFVRSTSKVTYTPNCTPQVVTVPNTPSLDYPEWKADVFPGMVSYCSSCHTGSGSGVAALSWNSTNPDEAQLYSDIAARRFASAQRGAIGSQLYWAARGLRTDGRSNTAYPPQYSNTNLSGGARWGFFFSSAHGAAPNSCANSTPGYADWVLKLGQWIDNHMPRDASNSNPHYKHDWYHPTGDLALTSPTCVARGVRVGWWDDTNQLKEIKVSLNSTLVYQNLWNGTTPIPNGSATFQLTQVAANSDVMTVEVIDKADNRQIYKKKISTMKDECAVPFQLDPVPIGP